jgi:hypothetical protein
MTRVEVIDKLSSLLLWFYPSYSWKASTLVKELDYQCMYSTEAKMNIVRTLCNIELREKQKDNKKLQRLINHYAIEGDSMMVLKP